MDDSANIPLKCCNKCKQTFPATTEFFYHHNVKGGLHATCKECVKAKRRSAYTPHPWHADVPDGYKRCSSCQEIKPATAEYFHKAHQGAYHLQSKCKDCRRKSPLPEPLPDGYKRCTQCQQVQPIDDFSQEKRSLDGHRSACKTCLNKESKQYRHDLGETLIQRRAQDYQKHKVKYRTQHKQYYQNHREEARAYHSQYQQEHKEKISERSSRWRQTERGRSLRRSAHQRRRAHKRNTIGSFTSAQIQEQLKRQKYRCYYAACGHAKFEKKNSQYVYHIDHTFPLSRVAGTDIPANDMSYLVLTCPSCNMSKKDKFPWEWPEGGRLL